MNSTCFALNTSSDCQVKVNKKKQNRRFIFFWLKDKAIDFTFAQRGLWETRDIDCGTWHWLNRWMCNCLPPDSAFIFCMQKKVGCVGTVFQETHKIVDFYFGRGRRFVSNSWVMRKAVWPHLRYGDPSPESAWKTETPDLSFCPGALNTSKAEVRTAKNSSGTGQCKPSPSWFPEK